jgi:hypothetical protein
VSTVLATRRMTPDWTQIIAAAVGGGALGKLGDKAFDWWTKRHELEIDQEKTQDAVAASFRDEMRMEMQRYVRRIEELEQKVSSLQDKVWHVSEEREALRLENVRLRAENELLTQELGACRLRLAEALAMKGDQVA